MVEILGVAGVIASLVFVGVQVQQSAAATRSATVLQLKDSWVQVNLASATSPELARAFETLRTDGWEADPISNFLVSGYFRSLFHNWSNAYYQYLNGTLEESQWTPHLREVQVSVTDSVFWRVWGAWEHVYDDPFRVLVDSLRAAHVR